MPTVLRLRAGGAITEQQVAASRWADVGKSEAPHVEMLTRRRGATEIRRVAFLGNPFISRLPRHSNAIGNFLHSQAVEPVFYVGDPDRRRPLSDIGGTRITYDQGAGLSSTR